MDESRTQDPPTAAGTAPSHPHPFVGLWTTADGRIRQRLLPEGRYVEARGSVEAAYTGDYLVEGSWIYYRDDTGFSADGEFRDDVLYHAGMVMYRDPVG